MKNTYYLLALIALFGCNQPHGTVKNVADNNNGYPKAEATFIKQLIKADSIYNDQTNAIGQKEALDSGKVNVSNYIINTLNSKIENWKATVHSIQADDNIEVTFMIQKEADTSQYKSIILHTQASPDNATIKNLLKDLSYRDNVLVSGTFDKNANGTVDFTGYMTASPYENIIFINPQFNFTVTGIKKTTH